MTRDRLERWADRLARSASKDPDPLLLMRFGMVSGVLMMGIACLPAVSSPLVFLMGAYSLMSTRHLLERAGFIRMLEEVRHKEDRRGGTDGSRSGDRSHLST